jgi:hypothetical protein
MKKYIFLLLLSTTILSCREVIELDLPQQDPKLVVEATLNNTSGPQEVRLSLTTDYFSEAELPPVEDARVIISDDTGLSDTLRQSAPGLYLSNHISGEIGRTYTLHIDWNGNRYQSVGSLLEEAVIDSLNYRFLPGNQIFEEGYYIFFFGRVPPHQTNYFRFKVYRNDSLYNGRTDLLVQDDQFLPDTLENIRFNYPFSPNDTVKLEMYTLNREMYQYYLELITLLYNDGGLFSPPPQNPASNVRNLTEPDNPPLGYFQVAPITSDTVIIDPTTEE